MRGERSESRLHHTDSKINYGRKKRSLEESEISIDHHQLPEDKPTSRRYLQNYQLSTAQSKASTRQKVQQRQQETQLRMLRPEKSGKLIQLIILILAIISVIGIFVCEVILQFKPDDDCWQQFKQNRCDMTNPTGETCIRLIKCLSGSDWQINMIYVLLFLFGSWIVARFKRQIKKMLEKGRIAWQQFLTLPNQ